MPNLIDSALVLAVLSALIAVGKLMQRVSQLEDRQKQIGNDLKEHLGSANTHRSHDWEGEVRSTLGELKLDMRETSSKIAESLESLRKRADDDRQRLHEQLTALQVGMAKLGSK